MTEVKGMERRTQLLVDLSNRRRYWELKEEAEDRKKKKSGNDSLSQEKIEVLLSSFFPRRYSPLRANRLPVSADKWK